MKTQKSNFIITRLKNYLFYLPKRKKTFTKDLIQIPKKR